MAVLVKALVGAYSRFHFFSKIRTKKNMVDPYPVFNGYVYAPSVELRRALVGQGAREAQHRNADRVILLVERACRDSGHCS